jgi:hypothetical protein
MAFSSSSAAIERSGNLGLVGLVWAGSVGCGPFAVRPVLFLFFLFTFLFFFYFSILYFTNLITILFAGFGFRASYKTIQEFT